MAPRHMYYDKTEIVILIPGKKKVQTFNLSYNQIVRIQFDKCEERKFFFMKVPSEKIEIVTPKRANPIVFYKEKEKQYFEQYKQELEKFAKDNRITFFDNTKE